METIRQKFCCLWAPSFFKMLGCLHARILRILSAVSTRIPTPRKAITRGIRHALGTRRGCFQKMYNDIKGMGGGSDGTRTCDLHEISPKFYRFFHHHKNPCRGIVGIGLQSQSNVGVVFGCLTANRWEQ